MNRQRVLLTLILSLFLIASGSTLAEEPIADLTANDAGISFTMKRAGDATLVVSGPNKFHFSQTFENGEAPNLSLFDKQGDYLSAGNYTWTLTLHREAKGDRLENGSLEQPLALSGSFTVLEEGGLANPDRIEDDALRIPLKAQVIAQDLIVQGSTCSGFDCTSGESFGFDTLRLKENNLRIHFQDTSVSASFPSNDWRIVANDTSNGGANYMGIEDSTAGRIPFRVEAGAPINTLYVEADGDVGVKTANPAVDIHVVEGNTPTLRLEQDGSDGFTPQTFDVAANEANFFIRDVTNGSRLSFRIRPGAPESSIDIAGSGDVGIGTSSPDQDLDVSRAGDVNIQLENRTTTARWILQNFVDNANSAAEVFRITKAGTGVGEFSLDSSGNLTITGNLVTGGGGTCDPGPCDGTFIDYELESIEEHAAYMWENKHLWGVGPTPEGQPLNLSKKTTGILHELEKAHIYIEQLNSELKEKNAQLSTVLERLSALEEAVAKANP